MARPEIFENAFLNDPSFIDSNILERFITIDLGDMKIESGKIVICDPINIHLATPLKYTFPKGSFPVQLAVSYFDSSEVNAYQYVAYCRIKFSNQPVTRWLPIFEGSYTDSLHIKKPRYDYSAWTESGTIADEIARKEFINKPYHEWANLFVNTINDNTKSRKWKLYKFNKHTLVAYNGFDSNSLKVYIGIDPKGNLCRLLVDGGIFQLSPSLF